MVLYQKTGDGSLSSLIKNKTENRPLSSGKKVKSMDLSELTAYAEEKYNMQEQHKWSDFPGFSISREWTSWG